MSYLVTYSNFTRLFSSFSSSFKINITQSLNRNLLIIGGVALVAFVAYTHRAKRSGLHPTESGLQFTKFKNDEIRHFRQYSDLKYSNVNHNGIEKLLRFSGSGLFGGNQIGQIVDKINKNWGSDKIKILFLDLLSERHCFIDGRPAIWKGSEKDNETAAEISKDESRRIANISGKVFAIKDKKQASDQNTDGVTTISNTTVEDERTVVQNAGHYYIRLPFSEHHLPTAACVDEIIELIKKNTLDFFHVHCYVKARSTLVLAMIDMLYNAKEIGVEHILQRAKAIGGSDFTKNPEPGQKNYDADQARVKFLVNFHSYCQDQHPLENPQPQTWKEWANKNNYAIN